MTAGVPVIARPVMGPDAGAPAEVMAAGLTLAEIVEAALPGLPREAWPGLRLTMVHGDRVVPVPCTLWHRVRPHAGTHVVIRMVPGYTVLANVLLTVVSTAAAELGAIWGAALIPQAGTLQSVVSGLLTAGLTVLGSLLVNALIPQPSVDRGERRSSYAISGWRNEMRPGAPVPLSIGRHRYSPPFAAPSYTEIVDDVQYVRALFTFGYGRVDISDLRLGDTPLSEFDEVEVEIREGTEADDPVTLYPRQVLEEPANVELVRPLPRDDQGDVIEDGDPIDSPVVRWTASDASQVSVIISFPSGLFAVEGEGGISNRMVVIRIEHRPEGGSVWAEVTTLKIRAKIRRAFMRQHTWTLPYRGRWEVRFTRTTAERTDPQISDRSYLAAVQSIRPEYPLNMDKPLALVALRIKATHQISGTVDDFNAVVQRYAPMWDGESWTDGLSRNPASGYLTLLQSNANPYPVADAGIDLDQIADWYEFCADKGLKYDRVHDSSETLAEALTFVCAAGRASPRHDGVQWGVVIDRPSDLVVDHISPRTATGLSWRRPYFDPPDGFRIPFADETNDYEPAERIVPWPGVDLEDVELTEAIDLPGKTDPDEIWTEARRRMYELIHRPDTFNAIQDGQARVTTRGDQVMGSFDILSTAQKAGRVTAVSGALVALDEIVSMQAGTDYAIRFREFADEEDPIGNTVVRQVETIAGQSTAVRVLTPDSLPAVGEAVHFGPMGTESLPLRVKAVERGEGMASVLRMVAAADVIETLLADDPPPAWNGRVGAEVELASAAPAAPYFTGVDHGLAGTETADGLVVFFSAGGGTVPTATVRLNHRILGAGTWNSLTVPAANGSAEPEGYSAGDEVELQLIGIAADGEESVPSATISVVIGGDDPQIPGAIDETSVVLTPGLGFAQIAFATGADAAFTRLQVYRKPAGDPLDRDAHAVGTPVAVSRNTTLTFIDGDATRATLVADGGMDNPGSWSLDANWAIAAGVATHTAGAADAIKQPMTLTEGKSYRGAITVSGLTAGTLTPTLFGGTAQTDTAIAADGTAYFSFTAGAGNTDFGLDASSDCDASADNAVLFLVTPGCVDHGTYDWVLEPQNDLGGAGPVTSAFTGTII